MLRLGLATGGLIFASVLVQTVQAQSAPIQEAAKKTCAVMAVERKADGQTLQYLTMLDQDLSDPNPMALALRREVNKQCPKAYLSYQQRRRASNPFPAGSLVKQTLRCHGARGMATANGRNLVVEFARGVRSADQALQSGQCSWLDRGLSANEPARLVDVRPSAAEAQETAARINAGETWTFWVVNEGSSFKATALARGTPTRRP